MDKGSIFLNAVQFPVICDDIAWAGLFLDEIERKTNLTWTDGSLPSKINPYWESDNFSKRCNPVCIDKNGKYLFYHFPIDEPFFNRNEIFKIRQKKRKRASIEFWRGL